MRGQILRSESADTRPERAHFRSERTWAGSTDKRTDGMTNESPPVFYRTLFPLGPLPKNRSPRGNMWSAIPVALLCMIVIWSEGKQGSGPEGDEVL